MGAGNGWTLEIVGGAKRGLASHDADFVVSNKTTCAHVSPGAPYFTKGRIHGSNTELHVAWCA